MVLDGYEGARGGSEMMTDDPRRLVAIQRHVADANLQVTLPGALLYHYGLRALTAGSGVYQRMGR